MNRLDGPSSVKVINVVEVKAKRGLGIEKDPVCEKTREGLYERTGISEK